MMFPVQIAGEHDKENVVFAVIDGFLFSRSRSSRCCCAGGNRKACSGQCSRWLDHELDCSIQRHVFERGRAQGTQDDSGLNENETK